MKKIVNIILSTLLLCALCPFTFFNVEAQTNGHYSLYGSGTEHDPYTIRNSDEWNTFTSEVNSDPTHGNGLYFKVTNDIGREGKEVTNNLGICFNGILDGSNKTIWYGGKDSLLKTNNGEIKNIVIRSSKEMKDNISAVVCFENNGVIDHCANYISMLSSMSACGICSKNEGLIINSINYGSIKTTMNIGKTAGICDRNNGQIVNCINVGEVSWAGIGARCLAPSSYDICFNCSYPLPKHVITDLSNASINNSVLSKCFYYTPDSEELVSYNEEFVEESDNLDDIEVDAVSSISQGIYYMNNSISEYNNQTNRKLTKWKLDGNGLPTYDELPSTGFMLSNGNIWIIVVGVIVVIGGVVVIVINNKKNRTIHI